MRFNYIENRNGTITIDEIIGTGDILFIPSYINNHPVTTLSRRACKIPALKELYIPKTVIDIHSGAFYFCKNLEKIVVEKGNPVYDSRNDCNAIIETLSNKIIFGCMNTVIPEGIRIIGEAAFREITKLRTINIPDSVTKIKHAAFMGCARLKKINFSKNIKCIESYAFIWCKKLSNVTFDPDSELQEIDTESFGDCSFKEIILPKNIKQVKPGAFGNCKKLEKIVLNDGLEMIGEYAFASCESLKELRIPDSVKTIGNWICKDCVNLETVYFGKDIVEYTPGTFQHCDKIDTFIFANDFSFIAEELLYTISLKRIVTPDNVCRKNSLAILDYGLRNKITEMLENKYMDQMKENEFSIFIEQSIKLEWPEGTNRFMAFYNRKFGGPSRLKI